MPPSGRKGTAGRKKSWEFVLSAIDTQGEEAADQLIEVLSEDLREGEEMPDIRFFFTLLGRRMARFGTAMVEAHLDELTDDDALRQERDATTKELVADYIAMRGGYRTGYGTEIAAAVGFERHVATDPAEIELQIDRLSTNLGKPELVLPSSRYPGIAPQPVETLELFRPNLKRLKATRAALNRAHREADGSQLTKNDAVAAHDLEFPNLSRCFEACCTVAGLRELARRVRPSARRPGRREEEVQTEEAEASPPDEGSPETPAAASETETPPPEESAEGSATEVATAPAGGRDAGGR